MRQFLYSILFIGLPGVSGNSEVQNSAAGDDKLIRIYS